MKEPLVSIIVNCYNGEPYLRETLDSVRAQTHSNWEIIFWDNRSEDRSATIANGYGDARIKYFKAATHTNLGTARKLAVEQARGDYLIILDCDDLLLPSTLESQVTCMRNERAALAYGGYIVINTKGEVKRRVFPRCQSGHLFDQLLRRYEIGMSGTLLDRRTLSELNLEFDPNLSMVEDYCLFLLLAAERRVAVSRDVVAKIRFHADSQTNALMDRWAEEHEYTLRLIQARHPGFQQQYATGFRRAFARCHYFRARWLVEQGHRKAALRELGRIALVEPKFLVFFLALLLSPRLWQRLHSRLSSNRNLD